VYLPEIAIDLEAEAKRLKAVMDRKDCVTIFLSARALALKTSLPKCRRVAKSRSAMPSVTCLDTINPGKWFAEQFAKHGRRREDPRAEERLFRPLRPANAEDFKLIDTCVLKAVECAKAGVTGLIGHDEERGNELRAIEFPRIKGGKAFDTTQPWFQDLLKEIGQPMTQVVHVKH
jgi:pyrophosphate--fructose-6-phosphate 1-phosphotransferase